MANPKVILGGRLALNLHASPNSSQFMLSWWCLP